MNINKDQNNIIDNLQDEVNLSLVRHKSILDIMTKLQEYNSRINRAIAKSVTSCGCIELHAKKQDFESISLEDMVGKVDSHITGDICPNCKEVLEQEIGAYIYFLTALANTLDFQLSDTIKKELERTKALGVYGMK
ncbi:MAG: DUF1573 domain-containing protein [Gudongella sp.]|jgi:hypothetical protein|nr:DUF1573 domain-containing protein [Gudongella sp.]